MNKLPSPDGSDLERCKVKTLQQAFWVFKQLAETLAVSYRELEGQVARLNQELASAQSERLAALIEKETLANRLGRLLEVLPGGVIVLDGKGRVVGHNLAAVKLVGERWAAVSRQSFTPSNHPYERRLKNGRIVNISSRSLGDEPEQILLLLDVTETQALKELVDQHRHLAAMGEMAARLAYQVRTPLAAALLYASQLRDEGLSKELRLRFFTTRPNGMGLGLAVLDSVVKAHDGSRCEPVPGRTVFRGCLPPEASPPSVAGVLSVQVKEASR